MFTSSSSGSPNLQYLPTFDGTRKGLTAKSWLNDLEQVRILYNLPDQKMTPLARLRCVSKARDWAKIQPDVQTWPEFKAAFLLEYGEKNQDKLFLEMLNHTQDDASVGEYATAMQHFFRQLTIVVPDKQKEYFVRNLKMGLRESVFAAGPKTLAQAIEIARRAEDMYAALPGKQEEPGTEIRKLRKQVELLSIQKKAPSSEPRVLPRPAVSSGPAPPPVQNAGSPQNDQSNGGYGMRCLACNSPDHVVRDCKNPPKYPYYTCCNF